MLVSRGFCTVETYLAWDVTISHTLKLYKLICKRFIRVDSVADMIILLRVPRSSTLGLCRVRRWSSVVFVGLCVAVEDRKRLIPGVLLWAKVLLWLALGLGLEVHS